MSGRKSVDKGKAREREVVKLARIYFPEAARTGHAQGEGGAHRRPDVDGLPGVWLSVKGGAAPRVLDAVDEACEAVGQAGDDIPAVAFRRDGCGEWFVAVPLAHFLGLTLDDLRRLE
jgi:hypothetical protein